jgi:hypothetical protein
LQVKYSSAPVTSTNFDSQLRLTPSIGMHWGWSTREGEHERVVHKCDRRSPEAEIDLWPVFAEVIEQFNISIYHSSHCSFHPSKLRFSCECVLMSSEMWLEVRPFFFNTALKGLKGLLGLPRPCDSCLDSLHSRRGPRRFIPGREGPKSISERVVRFDG